MNRRPPDSWHGPSRAPVGLVAKVCAVFVCIAFALPVPLQASLLRNWEWVIDPATGMPRRTLRICFCGGEDFAVGGDTLTSLVAEAADNVDSRCVGGANAGDPCTAATAAADCPGGSCAGDQGVWTLVPFLTILTCPPLGVCVADCDIMIRVADHNAAGGAFSEGIRSAAAANRMQCFEERFDPTPRDNRGRCVTPGACVGGATAGNPCVNDAECPGGACGGSAVGAPCLPDAPAGNPDACPAGQFCLRHMCEGGANAGQACPVPGAAGPFCPGGVCLLPAVAWGLAGATLDPVAVESHELTHKCRINHEPVGGVTGRIPFDTGSFIDPVGVGNHQRRASQTDVNEGEAADAAPLLSFQGIVGPEGALVSLCATDIEDTCATVEIPPNALEGETILTIRPIMETTGPSSRSVPQPFLRIVSGVEIDSTVALLTRPARITLSYADFRVADSGYGAVDEATLTVFAYDPGLELWEPSVDFFLDSAANTVTFETFDLTPPAYGVGGQIPFGPLAPVCGDGILDSGEQCDDGNNNPGDGCDPNCRREGPREPFSNWVFGGVALGGQVSAQISGCTVSITTTPGQTAEQVAAAFAAAANADACVTSQGISATASGSVVTLRGFGLTVGDATITDPGLRHFTVPTLSAWGLAALAALLLAAGVILLKRRACGLN